ncbi:MAG TPA: acyl carrier protein [Streptosporangiaceae bacterium]|nr:acyl carrier protein [Streptosporangiaceae bacterium]
MTNQDGATQEDAAQDRAPQDSAARDRAAVLARLAAMLGELTADEAARTALPDTPLLRGGIGLDSLRATLLLVRVREQFGVDVADEDLNLDSLANIGTLATFIADRISRR